MFFENKTSYYYIVKNISVSDLAVANTANAVVQSGSISSDDFHIINYSEQYSFDGTEDYVNTLEMQQYPIASVSPAFWDLVGELNTPATHMAAHKKFRPFAQNDKDLCSALFEDLAVHLKYVIVATPTERYTWYDGALSPLIMSLSCGDLLAAATFLGQFTGASLAAAFGKGTAAQWQQLLDHVNMMAMPHLEKFPR